MSARRPEMDRFWEKTRRYRGCLLWTASKTNGYGAFGRADGKVVQAHRFLYQRVFGPVAKGLDVMHTCDRRACVALQHLTIGTRKQNMVDAAQKGRTKRGSQKKSAKFTASTVRSIRLRFKRGESMSALARELGVHPPCIFKIVRRHTWKHVK